MRKRLRRWKYLRRARILGWVHRFGGTDFMVDYGAARGWIGEDNGDRIVLQETPSFMLLRRCLRRPGCPSWKETASE